METRLPNNSLPFSLPLCLCLFSFSSLPTNSSLSFVLSLLFSVAFVLYYSSLFSILSIHFFLSKLFILSIFLFIYIIFFSVYYSPSIFSSFFWVSPQVSSPCLPGPERVGLGQAPHNAHGSALPLRCPRAVAPRRHCSSLDHALRLRMGCHEGCLNGDGMACHGRDAHGDAMGDAPTVMRKMRKNL